MKRRLGLVIPILLLMTLLTVGLAPANAQDAPQPIQLGINVQGTISATSPSLQYSFSAVAGQSIDVQVLSLTPNFAPAFTVVNGIGQAIANGGDAANVSAALATIPAMPAGNYILTVSSANGMGGDFVLSLQASAAQLPPPTPLTINQPAAGTVDSISAIHRYSFEASLAETLILSVESGLPNSGPAVSIMDATTELELVQVATRFTGFELNIPPVVGSYIVQVGHSGLAQPEPYTILLRPGVTQVVQATPTATLGVPVSTTCAVGNPSVTVNVRATVSTESAVVTQIIAGTTAQVIGRLADSSWWQINYNGITGWTSATVVEASGDCSGVPVAAAPAVPTSAPDATATPTFTPVPDEPTNTPEPTATDELPEFVGPQQPDLAIVGAVAPPTGFMQPVNVIVQVTNQGEGNSGATTVIVQFAGDKVGEGNLPALQPGQTVPVVIVFGSPNPAPAHSLTIVVDPTNENSETNENNNQTTVGHVQLPQGS
jgi:uncharacterized protein YraI